MESYNIRKDKQLGMPHGTACNKLRKMLIFKLAKQLDILGCYRCKEQITSVDDLSIEHKIPWLHSRNPREIFFDLENIAFSHLKCNVPNTQRGSGAPRRKQGEPGTAWCASHKKFLPISLFSKNASRWNGLGADCIECGNQTDRRGR